LNDLYSQDFYKDLPRGMKSAKGKKCFSLHDCVSYLFTDSCGIYVDETVFLGSNDEICVYAKLCNDKMTLFTTKVWFSTDVSSIRCVQYLTHEFPKCESKYEFIDNSPILADLIQQLMNSDSDLEWCCMSNTLRDLYSRDFYKDLPKGILLQNGCFHDAGKWYKFTDSCGIYEDETVLLGSNDEICVCAKSLNGKMTLFTSKICYVMRIGMTLIHKFPKCDYLGNVPNCDFKETNSDDNVILKKLIIELDEYHWDDRILRETLENIYSQEFFKGFPRGITCKGTGKFDYAGKRYVFDEFCGKYQDGVVLLGCDGKKCVFVNQEMKLLTADVERLENKYISMYHYLEKLFPNLEESQDFQNIQKESKVEVTEHTRDTIQENHQELKEGEKVTRYYLRTCDTDHDANDKIRKVCQESTLHEITHIGQVIHAPTFSCEVLSSSETEIILNRKITKFKTSDIFEDLSMFLTRDELHKEIEKLCNSEKFHMKQTFAANVSYPETCAQFFVMKLD